MPSSIPRPGTGHVTAHEPADRRLELAEESPDDVDPQRARAVIDVAVRTANLLLGAGASAAATTALVRRIAHAYALPVVVDITYNRIVVSHGPSDGQATTVVQLAPTGGLDHDRLARVERLVERICDQHLELDVAAARLRHIAATHRSYREWIQLLAAMVLGGGLAALLGGDPVDVAACMVATTLVEVVRAWLLRRRISRFFAQALSACVPTALGLALMAGRGMLPPWLRAQPSVVVAAGMVSLLAGVGIVMAAADAVDGYYMTSGGRMIEVVVLTSAIVLGMLATLWVGLTLGVPAHLVPEGGATIPTALRLVGGALVATCFAVSCNLPPGALWIAAAFGVLAQGGHQAAAALVASPIAATAAAAVLVGALARLLHQRLGLPIVAIVTPAVGSLMPGLLLYRGVFALTADMPTAGARGPSASSLLSDCALTAVALAAGSSLGISLAGLVLVLLRRGPEHLLHPHVVNEPGPRRHHGRWFG